MHVCMYAGMHVWMHTLMHVCMYGCMDVCMYACTHNYIYIYIYIYLFIPLHTYHIRDIGSANILTLSEADLGSAQHKLSLVSVQGLGVGSRV